MIPVLRKVAQLNIKYRKNGVSMIDVCTGAPPGEVTDPVSLLSNIEYLLVVWSRANIQFFLLKLNIRFGFVKLRV